MKLPVFFLFTLLSSTALQAQEWKSNLDEGLREAATSGKRVLLFFTLSEGCENCTRLDTTVFHSTEFRDVAASSYVLVKMDFTKQAADKVSEVQSEKNLLVVEKYNKDGFFPYVVVLNKDGKKLGKSGIYREQTPSQYVEMLQSFESRAYAIK